MSIYAHVMCEACFLESELALEFDLTDEYEGRRCCWCKDTVEFAIIVHRHPDAVKCKGVHE